MGYNASILLRDAAKTPRLGIGQRCGSGAMAAVLAIRQIKPIWHDGASGCIGRDRARTSVTQAIRKKSALPAPVAPRRPHSFTTHGITVVDDYAWLKDPNWQEVLRDPSVLNPDIRKYLEAENDYTESLLGHTADLPKTLD